MKEKVMLGRSGIQVSAIGMGCWAIGGDSYGAVDDSESIRAIHRALDLGVDLLDTANVYGNGHSERVIGQALQGRRQQYVVATKYGYGSEEHDAIYTGGKVSRYAIAQACEASLKRLKTDYIDLYQLHIGDLSGPVVDDVIEALEDLLQKGKIRTYGWNTDTVENARRFAALPHCSAIQYQLNLFYENAEIERICDKGVVGLIRGPLAMGTLTGKYKTAAALTPEDVRGRNIVWVPYFKDGKMTPEFAGKVEAAREILTSRGRTLAQGALAWLWARSATAIPIPGFRTLAQVEENIGALRIGPLEPEQVDELARLIPPLQWQQL